MSPKSHTGELRPSVLRRIRRNVRQRLGGTESAILLSSMVLFLLTGVGNSVYFKKLTNAVPNYSWFITVACTLAFIPIFGVIVLYEYFRGYITPDMQKFPKYKFALMGFLDAASCFSAVLGGAFTSGPTQMVLGQTVVPFTLILSTAFLGHRFHFAQHFGSLLIIVGVVAAKIPLFLHGEVASDRATFNLIFLSSSIASAFSQIYKEVAFQDASLTVNYLQFWVAFFQTLWTVLFAPLNALNFLGTQRVPLAMQLSMLTHGAECVFVGHNTIVENCGVPLRPVCDACAGAWWVLAKYLSFNVLVNYFALVIVKEGSAALSNIVATLRLPLTSACFYSHAIMGPDAVAASLYDLLGLLILLTGLGLYRYGAAALASQTDIPLAPDEGLCCSSSTARPGEEGCWTAADQQLDTPWLPPVEADTWSASCWPSATVAVVRSDDDSLLSPQASPTSSNTSVSRCTSLHDCTSGANGLFGCVPEAVWQSVEELLAKQCDGKRRHADQTFVAGQLGNVILGPGPFIFTLRKRRPLYLTMCHADNAPRSRLTSSQTDYEPPPRTIGNAVRKTLHDFRPHRLSRRRNQSCSSGSENSLYCNSTTAKEYDNLSNAKGMSIMLDNGLDLALAS